MQPRIRVAAIICQNRQVLLVRHEKNARSYWLLPGGGVQYGESLEAALKRELIEEVALDVQVSQLVLANDTIAPDGSRHIVNLYFTAQVIGGELAIGGDARVVEARYTPLGEVASLVLHPDIGSELVAGIREGFQQTPRYLGVRWRDLD